MPAPENKSDLQRFLGMVTYLGKFVPNLSEVSAPLRELLEKNLAWSFDTPQRQAFQELKLLITNSPILKYFDPKLPIKVFSDASKSGLGATLEQKHGENWFPVAFASRSMNPAETNYVQIEKEILSIVFACERFNDFLYGQRFTVENDHKPLKDIFKKPVLKSPPRIQRFLLRLQKYQFSMNYTPGKDMVVADTLSRAYLTGTSAPEIDPSDMTRYVHFVLSSLPISDTKLREFQRETSSDSTLQNVKDYVQQGWPRNKKDLDPQVQPYYQYRDEIIIANDLLLRNERIIVPNTMRPEMRTKIHAGHLGIERSKARAREALFWPGMTSKIADMIGNCSICLEHRNKQRKEYLIPHEIPDQPWVKVGTDLFNLKNKNYLLVVDYHSKFFEICLLPDTLSSTIVTHMKSIFARYGIPKIVISDNGPQYSSFHFTSFAKQWDFKHVTSSPRYPQSNGMAERTVQTVKKLIKKALQDGEDPYIALLNFRTSPTVDGGPSPAFKLMQRNPRTLLPSAKQYSVKAPTYSTTYCNRDAKDLPSLKPHDTVRIQNGTSWHEKGKVIEPLEQPPRSYTVETENGSILRRNRRDLMITKEKFTPSPDTDIMPSTNTATEQDQDDFTHSRDSSPVPVCTRSGRQVIRPIRYKDYV